jgi:hypothetical protein
VAGCTHALRDISVHDLLEEHCNGATQEIRFRLLEDVAKVAEQ